MDFLSVLEMKISERDSNDEIMKAFNLFDKDHNGLITVQNLKQIAAELGEELTDEEIQVIFFTKNVPFSFFKTVILLPVC